MVCTSGLLMGSLTLALAMSDIWFWRGYLVPFHLFMGGIITFLFLSLCHYGYESVNWAMIGIVIVCLLLSSYNRVSDKSSKSSCSKKDEGKDKDEEDEEEDDSC